MSEREQKRYYWLKLKEDFFEEDTLQYIEEQEHGTEYCLFYLKLCLKSLKTDGVLIRQVGSMLIPYDVKKLASMTNTNVDTALVAMELFKKIGLIDVMDNGAFYLNQLSKMVGSETGWAAKKREQRLKNKSKDNVPKLSGHSQIELEKEKEKEKELEKELEKEKDKEIDIEDNLLSLFEKLGFGYLNPVLADELILMEKEFSTEWVKEALIESVKQGVRNLKYVRGILNNWKTKGFKSEKDIKNNMHGINIKPTSFNNFKGRNYTPEDFKNIEDQFLDQF